MAFLTTPVKCFWQAASLHKGRVILTNHARELEFQWEFYDDVRDSLPDKQRLKKGGGSFWLVLAF